MDQPLQAIPLQINPLRADPTGPTFELPMQQLSNDLLEVEPHPDLAAAEDVRTEHHVLMHGETLGVIDPYGGLSGSTTAEHGLYYMGTRHLSRLALTLAHHPLSLLSSRVALDNVQLIVDLMNDDFTQHRTDPSIG